MGRICEILFFAAFVKASPQDEHGGERPALSQGCGGGVAPTSSLLFLLSLLSLQNPFIPSKFSSKSLTQVCHFFENFGDFSAVENFFELSTSYQQFTFFDAVF